MPTRKGLALLALALIPAAVMAWRARDGAQLGHFHDDSLYWVGAKSLAAGGNYRIASLPGQPFQTKYPPLYPLLLAGVWRAWPDFPGNLQPALLLAWPALPAFVLLAHAGWLSLGLPRQAALALATLAALNPFAAFFGMTLVAELPLACLLVACLIAAEGARTIRAAAIAGLLGGAAYLTKTAAVPLLLAAPLCFLLRGRGRAALAFLGAMLPAVLGWALWVRAHLPAATDAFTLYYTDYLGYHLSVIAWGDLPALLWRNLDALLTAAGRLLSANLNESWVMVRLSQAVAVGAVAGAVRLARRTGLKHYHAFAAGYVLLLVLWHYPPNERLAFPILPVLLAGAAEEAGHIARLIAASWNGRRAAAVTAVGVLACLAGWAGWSTARTYSRDAGLTIERHRARLAGDRLAYRWMAAHVPADAAVVAYRDVVLHLYTGRRTCRLTVPPTWFYRDRPALALEPFQQLARIARQHNFQYLYLTETDFSADLPERQRQAALALLRSSPGLRPLYNSSGGTVYAIE